MTSVLSLFAAPNVISKLNLASTNITVEPLLCGFVHTEALTSLNLNGNKFTAKYVVVCCGVLWRVVVCCGVACCGVVWCAVLSCAALCCAVLWSCINASLHNPFTHS